MRGLMLPNCSSGNVRSTSNRTFIFLFYYGIKCCVKILERCPFGWIKVIIREIVLREEKRCQR
uniref:Uncharacterized protein n=1 Tax=uncultured marine virus TaxID=186617 RepID=A0A0F7L0X3_9VIRU|nr:hypothetical protein [uncultured marine virus]